MSKRYDAATPLNDRQSRRLDTAKKYMRNEITREEFPKIEREYESGKYVQRDAEPGKVPPMQTKSRE